MKKRRSHLFVIMMILIMSMFVIPAQASSRSKAYKAYRSWIKGGCKNEYGYKNSFKQFCLVKIDSDSVPELIGKEVVNYAINSMCIVSYKNGKLIKKSVSTGVGGAGGFRGDASFIPKKGKIYMTSISSGTGMVYDSIIKLGKRSFKAVAEGSFQWLDMEKNTARNCTWKGKRVSKKVYDAKLKKGYPSRKAKKFDDLKFVSKRRY